VALEGCWELMGGSDPIGRRHAFECCCTYVPMLETIARDSSKLRNQALDLAARYALLQTLLSWGCTKRSEAVMYAQNALFLCKETGDIALQLSARPKLCWTYITGGRYTLALETMQEGAQLLKSYQRRGKGPALPSGVIGNFYSSCATAEISNGILPDSALGIATESQPLDNPIALVEFSAFDQAWEAAWIYSAKGDSGQAMKWLSKIIDPETLLSVGSQSSTGPIETVNLLTSVLLQEKERDMGQIIKAWTVGMEGAQTLRHDVRYQEAMTNFAIMKALWPNEEAIRKLTPLTSHW